MRTSSSSRISRKWSLTRVRWVTQGVVASLLVTLAQPAAGQAVASVPASPQAAVRSALANAVVRQADGSTRSLAAVRAAAAVDGDFPVSNGDLVIDVPTDLPRTDLQARVDAEGITNIGTTAADAVRSYAAVSGIAAASVDASIPSFTGHIEAVDGALRLTIPRNEISTSNWWQAGLAAALGAAAGILAAAIVFLGLTALGPAGAAVASRVAIPVFGFSPASSRPC